VVQIDSVVVSVVPQIVEAVGQICRDIQTALFSGTLGEDAGIAVYIGFIFV
jgi:hypothetical protein